jgi:hypothetical protein
MVFTLRITGPPAIEAAFQDFSGTMIRYGLREPVDYAFEEGRKVATLQSPVKTGYLRSSIKTDRLPQGARLIAEAPYALFVDKRVPYFSNAIEHIQRILPPLVQRAISEQASRLTRKFFGG